MNMQAKWGFIIAAIFLFAVAAALSLWLAAPGTSTFLRLVVWVVCALAVLLFASGVTGVRAALVDEFNRYSLQRVITFCWFIAIASAFLGISFWNVALWKVGGSHVSFFVAIDASIWALAGVVLGGLVGNNVVNAVHANTEPKNKAGGQESAFAPDPRREASMYRNLDASEAAPTDVVKNSQFGVQNTVDMSAVQQLMFQAAVLVAYVVAVGRLIVATAVDASIDKLPGLPPELLALLGVSAAAQVGNAAIPKAKTTPDTPKPTERFWLEGAQRAQERLDAEKAGTE
jgi:hypothetical protein